MATVVSHYRQHSVFYVSSNGGVVEVGIPHVEARHASLRRIKNAASSTWSVSVQLLSAYFTRLRQRVTETALNHKDTIHVERRGRKSKPRPVGKYESQANLLKGKSWRLRLLVAPHNSPPNQCQC